MKSCPACQREVQGETSECPYCGVVFAKWKGAERTKTASSPAVGPAVDKIPEQILSRKIRHHQVVVISGLALLLVTKVLWILLAHNRLPDGGMTITFIILCMGAGWIMSAIGLRDLARAKGRSDNWALLALYPGFAVVGLAIVSMLPARAIPQTAMPDGVRKTSPEGRNLRGTIGWAVGIYVFDALMINQGAIAALMGIVVVLWMLPRMLFAAVQKDREQMKLWAAKAVIFAVMVVAVFGSNSMNNQLARHRAETLISACKAYQAKYQKLPDHLEDIVPEFIPEVPLAKFALMYNRFYYIPSEGHHILMWIALPPFGRPQYFFEEDRWGYLD